MTIREHTIASPLRASYELRPLRFSKSRERRAFNESVLRPDLPLHPLAREFAAVVRTEAATLLGTVGYGEFGWPEFSAVWWSAARRITLGEAAREDHDVTHPGHPNHDAIATYLRTAEPGSLAAQAARTLATSGVDPIAQLRQWLFGFGAAGIITLRTLALLATHPEQAQAARDELAATDFTELRGLPYLRARVLESMRSPFGACPGRNIVLGSAATMLAALLAQREFTLVGQPSLDLRFVSRRTGTQRSRPAPRTEE
ncbi:MAG TPA: hypothetical protein VGN81_10760 [Pseudonocardiaceae bacterium]|jgi:cytochrome P450